MLKSKEFRIIIEQDEKGYFVAEVPELPGCFTQAKNLEELRKRVKEVILLCLEVAKTDPEYRKKIKNFGRHPIFVGLETIRI